MARVRTISSQKGDEIGVTNHPNFHASGNVAGMRQRFYGDDALLVRCGDWVYNVPKTLYDQAH